MNFIAGIDWNYKELNHYSGLTGTTVEREQGDFTLSPVINDQPRLTKLYKKHNEVERSPEVGTKPLC